MTNQTTTAGVQPTQTTPWELMERSHTWETIDTYETLTGHYVSVQMVHHEMCSHVHIQVTDETAFVNACNVHFDGFNHETVASDFVENYLCGSDLEGICKYFDELCIEFDAVDNKLSEDLA